MCQLFVNVVLWVPLRELLRELFCVKWYRMNEIYIKAGCAVQCEYEIVIAAEHP